jgi:hypothetical protein
MLKWLEWFIAKFIHANDRDKLLLLLKRNQKRNETKCAKFIYYKFD